MTTLIETTASDKAVVQGYVTKLIQRGFCKIDDASANYTRLLNRFSGDKYPMQFVVSDFDRHLRASKLECSIRDTDYIVRTLPHVVGTRFHPTPGAFYIDPVTQVTYANTYRDYTPSTTSDDVSPLLLELFERLAPDAREREVLLQWLAHIFQQPGVRPSWHIMVPSDTGTGKGFLLQSILHPLLHHTAVIASYDRLTGQFSTLLEDNLLVLLDDCKAASTATQTKLKSLLTEERQFIERKNAQGRMASSFTRFILATNERKPLHLDATERRWFVLSKVEHRHHRAETQAFIGRLADWLQQPGSLCRVFNYFQAIDLAGFNPKAVPHSAGLQKIIDMSRDPHVDFVTEYAQTHKVFSFKDIGDAFRGAGMVKPGDRRLRHLIEEVGYVRTRPIIEGTQVSLYHPPDMSTERIRELLAPAF